ncbi:MAG: sulfite reductase flavoprotein subunit alpha [Pseudomonadota bacterium]
MQKLIIQFLKLATPLLLILQILLIGLAASTMRDHSRSDIYFDLRLTEEAQQPRAATDPPDKTSTSTKPLHNHVLWQNQNQASTSLWITDDQGVLVNRVSVRTLATYELLALFAVVTAVLLIGLAFIATFRRMIPIAAAGGIICVGLIHFATGLSQHFTPTQTLSLSFSQQLAVVALGLVIFLICYWRVFASSTGTTVTDRGQRTLLAYASQSGSARELARRFAAATHSTCDLLCVSQLSDTMLLRYENVLLVASTHGDGEPPERARGFVKKLEQGLSLPHQPNFAILALGDRRYANFCAFGHRLYDLMCQAGASPLHPVATVNRLEQTSIAQWWQNIAVHFGWDNQVAQTTYRSSKIVWNRPLNPDSESRHVHLVEFTPLDSDLDYQPGDLLEIKPRFDPIAAERYLKTIGLDSKTTVTIEGASYPLIQALKFLEWQGAPSKPAQEFVTSLSPVQVRTYSLASAPGDTGLRLMVRRRIREDGTPGVISNQLCDAKTAEQFQIAVRKNPDFRLPAKPAPIIMIAAGTGLAPFLGFLSHLKQQQSTDSHWLFYGERQESQDHYFKTELEDYHQAGLLQKLITAWSRDPAGAYVQTKMDEHKTHLINLVNQQHAHIYICGAQQGFGDAVCELLRNWFGAKEYQDLVDQARLHTDLY